MGDISIVHNDFVESWLTRTKAKLCQAGFPEPVRLYPNYSQPKFLIYIGIFHLHDLRASISFTPAPVYGVFFFHPHCYSV
jgi:hypothetical protein